MRLGVLAACILLLLCGRWAFAQKTQKTSDPMGESFFPPDLLLREAEAIGLTDEQKQFLQKELQTVKSRFSEFQQQLQKEMTSLAEILAAARVDEQKAVEQLDKVLEQERQIRREQLKLLVSIKNQLTPQQQAKAREIMAEMKAQKGQGKALPPSLQAKMEKVQGALKKWKQEGRDWGSRDVRSA